jgi:uncharacterized damage-inducible protein DinB
MREARRIAGLSASVLEGHPWHASAIAALLRGITAEEALARPVKGCHSIIEIVLHMTSWAEEVEARLQGQPAGTPATGNWPSPSRIAATDWAAARRGLMAACRALEKTISRQQDATLDRPVDDPRTPSGKGATVYATAHGIIHHAVYHSGQIALLKKALRSER